MRGSFLTCVGTGLLAAYFLAGGAGTARADKIEFSTPAERYNPQIQQDNKLKAPPRDSFGSTPSPADSFNFTPQTPRPARPSQDSLDDKFNRKKDWIFAKPEDSSADIEKALGLKPEKTEQARPKGFLERFMEEPSEAADSKHLSRDKAFSRDIGNDFSNSASFSANPAAADPARQALWNQLNPLQAESRNNWLNPERDALAELWKIPGVPTGRGNDLFSNKADLANRRSEINQLFEPRGSADLLDPLADATRQVANPVTAAPNDIYSRSTQTSLADQWKGGVSPLTGVRSQAFEDVNARALGSSLSSQGPEVNEPIRMKPQPAVLPFPARPGELFKRPGTF